MKITNIIPYPVWVGTRNQMLVKVETDEDLFGWGESGLSGREKAVAGAVEHYARFLIGRDPMRIGALWQEMYRSQYFEGGRVLTAAISAIDIALHDIKGKALGVPVYDLLGGRQRDRIPTFASASGETDEEIIASARMLKAAGWDAIRLFPHGQNRQLPLRAPRRHRPDRAAVHRRARGRGSRGGAGHRLASPPVGGRGRQLLPEAAAGHAGLPGRTDPRRDRPRPTRPCAG